MSENVLQKIIEQKKIKIQKLKNETDISTLLKNISEQDFFFDFKKKIEKNNSQNKISVIAEIKKASPSAGILINNYDKYSTILGVRDGIKKNYTEGQTLEAWANHSAMTLSPKRIDNKDIKVIERKLMNYFAPNTTKGFDDLVNNLNDLNVNYIKKDISISEPSLTSSFPLIREGY